MTRHEPKSRPETLGLADTNSAAFAPLMKYQDGAANEDINHAMDKVSQIFEVEIPKKDFEEVSTEDLVQINQKI
jgi:hypothetical protein